MRSAYDNDISITGRFGNVVREHPVAVTLIGLGLAWLAMTARSGERGAWARIMPDGMSHRVRRAGENVRDAAEQAYHRANDTVRTAAEHLRDQVSSTTSGIDAGGMLRSGGDRVSRTARDVTNLVEDNPLIGGAIGLAAGIAIGAALPTSRLEDSWMGEASDRTYDQLKNKAEDALDRGLNAASETLTQT